MSTSYEVRITETVEYRVVVDTDGDWDEAKIVAAGVARIHGDPNRGSFVVGAGAMRGEYVGVA